MIPLLLFLLSPPDEVALTGARIQVSPGRAIEVGVVVVRDGRIAAVEAKGKPPEGAEVIQLPSGSVVVPGFIDLHSHLGSEFEVEEETESVTPHVRAVEAFATRHEDVRRALASGVTAVALAPGNGNLVGGRVGIVKLNGGRYDRALYRTGVAVKVSLGAEALRRDREPTSRTGAVRMLRALLADEKSDLRRLPILAHVETVAEIESALELRDAFGLNLVLLHAKEAWRCVDRIRVPVALGPLTVSDPEILLTTPARLARARIPFAFVSDAPRSAEAQLRVSAALAVRSGLPREEALKALTTTPARILGLSERMGVLEPGKDADLAVYSGDPLSLSSDVELVMVDGKIVHRKGKP